MGNLDVASATTSSLLPALTAPLPLPRPPPAPPDGAGAASSLHGRRVCTAGSNGDSAKEEPEEGGEASAISSLGVHDRAGTLVSLRHDLPMSTVVELLPRPPSGHADLWTCFSISALRTLMKRWRVQGCPLQWTRFVCVEPGVTTNAFAIAFKTEF